MSTFKESLNNLVQKDQNKNIVLGQIAFNQLLARMPGETEEESEISLWVLISSCFRVIDSNGKRSNEEISFLSKVLDYNFSSELIDKKLALFNKQTDMFLESLKSSDEATKNNFVSLAALICYADGSIDDDEVAYLEGLVK